MAWNTDAVESPLSALRKKRKEIQKIPLAECHSGFVFPQPDMETQIFPQDSWVQLQCVRHSKHLVSEHTHWSLCWRGRLSLALQWGGWGVMYLSNKLNYTALLVIPVKPQPQMHSFLTIHKTEIYVCSASSLFNCGNVCSLPWQM